ncbi:hypothetical protein BYT27DRAFT_7103483 [Phlegmacium glaucopus]|nr:hypothetical protein BYT27DRAFT_7103483 [Phlegmacium glaucopus]
MPAARRCLTCRSVFTTLLALREHCSSLSHASSPYVCNPCNRSFGSIRALQNHLNSPRHADDPVVGLAAGSLSMDGQDDSYSQAVEGLDENHSSSTDMATNMDNFCSICCRNFKSARGLELHMASIVHSGRVLGCPLCKFKYKSASGMAMHLEGSCKSKVTRHQVTNAVHSMGFTPDISIGRCIEGSSQIITTNPSITSQLFATEASFNGSYYVCPFVDCRKRKFRSLCALNRHLDSPAHDDNQFKCPGCHTEFKLISGFIQHVEARNCVDTGSATFEQIEIQIGSLAYFFSDNLVGGGAMIEF